MLMSTIRQQKQSLNNQKMKSTIHNPSFCEQAKQYRKNNNLSLSKKLFLTLVIALFSTTIFAQAAFDKFDGQENVTSVIVNKKMFELMSKVKVDATDKEAQAY